MPIALQRLIIVCMLTVQGLLEMSLIIISCRCARIIRSTLYKYMSVLRSSLFWHIAQCEMVVTNTSEQPIDPNVKGKPVKMKLLLDLCRWDRVDEPKRLQLTTNEPCAIS